MLFSLLLSCISVRASTFGNLTFESCRDKAHGRNSGVQEWIMPAIGEYGRITPLSASNETSAFQGRCLTSTKSGLTMQPCTNSTAQTWVASGSLGGSVSLQSNFTTCTQGPRCCMTGPWHKRLQRVVGDDVSVFGCDCASCEDQRFIYNNKTLQLRSVMSRLCITASLPSH